MFVFYPYRELSPIHCSAQRLASPVRFRVKGVNVKEEKPIDFVTSVNIKLHAFHNTHNASYKEKNQFQIGF